jgi:hypothetical protein
MAAIRHLVRNLILIMILVLSPDRPGSSRVIAADASLPFYRAAKVKLLQSCKVHRHVGVPAHQLGHDCPRALNSSNMGRVTYCTR